jgi:predicted transposase YdaD
MGLLPLAPLSARELDQIPIIVERLKERVDPAAVTAEISELWTSAAVMAGLRFPWELIKHCFGGITAMRESSTIQAFIEEGRRKGLQEGEAREARRIILRQGRIRFGEAGDAVRSRLEAISDLEQLELLGDRLLIVSSWDQLLGQEEP